MTFVPIIERELRVRARGRAAYWTRFGVGLAGMLICLPPALSYGPFRGPGTMGHDLLNAIVSAAFLVSCAGCLLTADIIGSERREGTLGLLLLTRVRVFDVLLGKLGSAGLTSLCALVTLLPMLMLPVLAGGVTGGEAFRKGLVLLDTLFLALAAGLWASARGREWLKTGRDALIVMAAVVLAPYLAALLLGSLGTGEGAIELLSPLCTLSAADAVIYRAGAGGYWVSLLLVQLVGWALLASAVFRLRRGWREERGEVTGPASSTLSAVEAEAARPSCRPLADDMNPIAWLLRRQRGLRALLWAGASVGLSQHWVVPLLFRFVRPTAYWGVVSPLTLAIALVSGALFAWAASRFFVEARRTGQLELLLTTPLGARQVVAMQWQLLKRALLWPLVVMIVPTILQAGFVIATMGRVYGPAMSYRAMFGISELIACVNIILGVWALCWLGVWFGLRSRGQGRAVVWTVGMAKGVPYVISVLFWILFIPLTMSPFGRRAPPYWIMTNLPQIVNLFLYLGLINWARRRLLGGLAGADLMKVGVGESLLSATRNAASAWRKARHWTPS